MGKRGPNKQHAMSKLSGFVERPSDRREFVENKIGSPLSDLAWSAIDRAWRHITMANEAAKAPCLSGKAATSYPAVWKRTGKLLTKAHLILCDLKAERKSNAAIDAAQSIPFSQKLDEAIGLIEDLEDALAYASCPDPTPFANMKAAQARTIKEIAEAVTGEIDVSAPKTLGVDGLSKFQTLILALGMYHLDDSLEDSDEAFAVWLYRRRFGD